MQKCHQKNNKTLQTQPIKNNIIIVVGPDGRSQKICWTNLSQAHPVHKDPEDLGNAKEYVEEHKADRKNIISQATSPVKDLVTGYEKIINISLSSSSSQRQEHLVPPPTKKEMTRKVLELI